MPATYVTSNLIASTTLVETYQAFADMFSTLSALKFQQDISVVITALAVNVDGSVTVTTADVIPEQINPVENLGLIRTA